MSQLSNATIFYVYDWSAREHARDANGLHIYRANEELAGQDAIRYSQTNGACFVTTAPPGTPSNLVPNWESRQRNRIEGERRAAIGRFNG